MGLKDLQDEGYNPFVEALKPPEVAKATGPRRLASLAIRGATFGALGAKSPAEGILENVTEFAGSLPSIVGVSAALSPLTGMGLRAAGLARTVVPVAESLGPAQAVTKVVSPALARLTAAGATGGVVGAAEAATHGEDVLTGAAKTAAGFAVGEGAFIGAPKVWRGLRALRSRAEATQPIAESVSKEVSDLPIWSAMNAAPATEEGIAAGYPKIRFGPDNSAVGKSRRFRDLGDVRTEFGRQAGIGRAPRLMLDDLVEPITPALDPTAQMGVSSATTPLTTMPTKTIQIPQTYPQTGYQKRFKEVFDPNLKMNVLIPNDREAADAVIMAEQLGRASGGIPIAQEQRMFLEQTVSKLDFAAAREPLLTSNLLKKSAEEVETALAANPNGLKMGEIVVVDKSPDAKAVGSTLSGIGVAPDEAERLVAEATSKFQTGKKKADKALERIEALGKRPISEGVSEPQITEGLGRIKKSKELKALEKESGVRVSDTAGVKKPPKPVKGATFVKDPQTGETIVFAPTPEMTVKQRKAWIAEQLKIRCKPGGGAF